MPNSEAGSAANSPLKAGASPRGGELRGPGPAASPRPAGSLQGVTAQDMALRKPEAKPMVTAGVPAAAGGLWAQRRAGVKAESTASVAAADIAVVFKADEVKRIIADAIKDNMLFQGLPPGAMDVIIDSMTARSVAPGTDIIRQGDSPASEFYVLEDGTAEVWVTKHEQGSQPTKASVCKSGSAFGELALLYSSPRAATVRAVTPCKLWVMERWVFNTVKRNFTNTAYAARHKLLDCVPALKTLQPQQRALLVDALQQVEFKAGREVFKKGDPGTDFYLIREGNAIVRDGTNGPVLMKLSPGDHFGERALLSAEPRAADVVAETRLVCYKLAASDFAALLGSRDEIWRFEALRKIPLLYNLNEQQLWQLARTMGKASYKAGDVVFLKGDPGDMFYVVQEGSFTCFETKGGAELARVAPGGCFGELALLRREPRAACVAAVTDAKVLTLSRDQFTAQLGNLAQLRNVWRLEALRRVPLLQGLAPGVLARLVERLQAVNVKEGGVVIKQGDVGDRFFIVEHGLLAASKADRGQDPSRSNTVLTYGPGSYFGELALLKKEPRAATVHAQTDSALLALSRQDFSELLASEPGLEERLAKGAEAYVAAGGKGAKRSVAVQMDEVHALAVLGAGGFGQVLLVRHHGAFYALKCIAKAYVVEQGLVQHIKREKDVMIECSYPFLVGLHGTAQDDTTLYMLLELLEGGELFGYLQSRTHALAEDHARFYVAGVVCALQYLHDKDLVYRDLKPENLLLDLEGYVRVADFGFVKRVPRGSKTYTLCGTPDYLAPEVIMNKGHNQAADWWAVGVLLYELVAGCTPFQDPGGNQLAMFKAACARQLTWPKHFSPTLRSLVDRLLDPNPLFRLGSGRAGAGEIKCHPFFAGFDWEAFTSRSLPAPYIPAKPRHPGDPINFRQHTPLNHVFRCKNDKPRAPFDDF